MTAALLLDEDAPAEPQATDGSDGSDRWLGCVHESAHAFAAVATGCELGSVTVGPRGGGRTWFRRPPVVPRRRALRDAVTRHLAGPGGEAVFLGLASLPFPDVEVRCTGGAADFAAARRVCGVPATAPAAILAWPWRLTVDLVARRWAAIERLARALQVEGTINGPRAVALLGGRR